MTLPRIDIDAHSPTGRFELAERLWDSLDSSPEEVPLTAAQEDELDRRLEAYREDRDPGAPWHFPANVYERRKRLAVYWYNKASDLRGSAGVLWAAMNDPKAPETAQQLGLSAGFSFSVACWPVYQMLRGMALELLLKAISVAKDLVPKPTHDLVTLGRDAGIAFTDKQIALLSVYSEAIVWEGRYPVPKQEQRFRHQSRLVWEHLFDPVPGPSGLHFRSPNDLLSWESFNRVWQQILAVYCETANNLLNTEDSEASAG